MILLLRRSILHLKSIGKHAYVPIIIADIVFPATIYMFSLQTGYTQELYRYIVEYSLFLFPISSIWWPIFILREYLEADGNELLFVNKYRIKIADIIVVFLAFMLNAWIQFIVFTIIFSSMQFEFLRLLCSCIMYLGMSYLIAFSFKSITLTLMTMLIYTLVIITQANEGYNFVFFITNEPISIDTVFEICIPQMCAGLLFLAFGGAINAHIQKFR